MVQVTLEERAEPERAAVIAVDVSTSVVRAGFVGTATGRMATFPTTSPGQEWGLDRLDRIVTEAIESAAGFGLHAAQIVVAVPGLVDPIHGVVQHSPGFAWHDVAVAHALEATTGCGVLVRERTRSAAAAEGVLGVAGECPAALFVSVGDDLGAALVQHGQVSPDRAQVGEIGRFRLRSGPQAGRRLEDVVRSRASRREMVGAVADALDWLSTVFAPELIVLGGELGGVDLSLVDEITAELTRRDEGRPPPPVRTAAHGPDAAWVGAALTGWRRARWPLHVLGTVVQRVAARDEERRERP